MFDVKLIEASISTDRIPIHTFVLTYPRFIHGEVMTHRQFCLAGDSKLDFELPAGSHEGRSRRVYSMSLRDFADKWQNGAVEGASSRHNGEWLEHLDPSEAYSAKEIASQLKLATHANLNGCCRKGLVAEAFKMDGEWVATGSSWIAWRKGTGTRRFSLRSRLKEMRIRQMNEKTGKVITSRVLDCQVSGIKEIFRVCARNYSVCGSKDHKILTSQGWKRIEELVPGKDLIATYKRGVTTQPDPHKFNYIDGRWVQTWVRQIRQEVADRQKGLCAISGKPLGLGFHIHHVEPRHKRPDLAFEVSNVIAVNPEAHEELHRKQGWQQGVPLITEFSPIDVIISEGLCDTYDLEIEGEFANFFADGVVVHNSRNAMSSRAIPVAKMLAQVRTNPAMPVHWGKNQPGMQAREEVEDLNAAAQQWLAAASDAARHAEHMLNMGLAKQVANRILEPFQWMKTIVTSTEWDNFFELRCHEDADPNFQRLAYRLQEKYQKSKPKFLSAGEWHLPFVTEQERGTLTEGECIKCSVARCARVSYLTHDNQQPELAKDIALFDKLVGSRPLHASPAEHQATPGYANNGNFKGWQQYRKLLESQGAL